MMQDGHGHGHGRGRIQLGLCCINATLRAAKPPVFMSRTMGLKHLLQPGGLDVLKARVRQNLADVLTMLEWNRVHNIRVMRLSSDLFPHMSNPKLPRSVRDAYTYEFARDLLEDIGRFARAHSMRLTFHPGQFNVIGTPRADVFETTCAELEYHATVLDMMGCDKHSVMVIHGGGVYGDKAATMRRWERNFHKLPANVQRRLVLENCEKSFSVVDCLALSELVDIPVVFDTHHHECYRQSHPGEPLADGAHYMALVLDTWARRGIKPKFHVSEQGSGKLGHHSDFIEQLPPYLVDIPRLHNVDIDIMVEAKAKEQAVLRLMAAYS